MRKQLIVWTLTGTLAACGSNAGGGAVPVGSDATSTREVELSLRSGVLEGATRVDVTLLGVELLVAGGTGEHRVSVAMEPTVVNLLELRGDASMLLGSAPVDGKINQIRLDMDGTVLLTLADGSVHEVTVPSGDRTGIKIIAQGLAPDATDVTLDFDPAKSIHQTGNGEWIMRPTIKLGDASGTTPRGGTPPDGTTPGGTTPGGTTPGNGHGNGHGVNDPDKAHNGHGTGNHESVPQQPKPGDGSINLQQ